MFAKRISQSDLFARNLPCRLRRIHFRKAASRPNSPEEILGAKFRKASTPLRSQKTCCAPPWLPATALNPGEGKQLLCHSASEFGTSDTSTNVGRKQIPPRAEDSFRWPSIHG